MKIEMTNQYLQKIIVNLSKFLTYLSICLLIINMYNYMFGSILLLDSVDNWDQISNENSVHDPNNIQSNQESTDKNISFFQKSKRFIYWRLFVNRSNRYPSYNHFKKAWNSEFSIRKLIKDEFKEFQTNPIKYIRQERTNTRTRIIEDNAKLTVEYRNRYVRGQGWYSESQVQDLAKRGYEIKDNLITKINK